MLFPSLVLGFGIAAPIMRTDAHRRCSRCAPRTSCAPRAARVSRRDGSGRGTCCGNALIPIVTMTGIQFGYLLGGAVVVEQIFSIPGIGRQVLLGIQQKEFALVQSTVLVIALAFVLVNLLTDLALPRHRPAGACLVSDLAQVPCPRRGQPAVRATPLARPAALPAAG